MLYGFPTEGVEDFNASIRFLNSNRDCIYGVQNSVFDLRKASYVFRNPDKFSISKIWKVGDYRSHGGYQYECRNGLNHEKINEMITQNAPFLSAFNPYSGAVQNFRDHALLIYSKHGDDLRKIQRRFPAVAEGSA